MEQGIHQQADPRTALQAALPWRYPRWLFLLGVVWFGIGVIATRLATSIPLVIVGVSLLWTVFALGLASIACHLLRNHTGWRRAFLGLLTLLSAVAPSVLFVGAVLVGLTGQDIVGGIANPPYARCAELPSSADLPAAMRKGFDVNRTCCEERMVGECSIVTEANRNAWPLAVVVSGRPDEDVEAYLRAGAKVVPGVLAAAAKRPSTQALERLLGSENSSSEIAEALYAALQAGQKDAASRLRKRISPEDGQREVRRRLLEDLGRVFVDLHLGDVQSPLEAHLSLWERELGVLPAEVYSELLCQLVSSNPRTPGGPYDVAGTQRRFDAMVEYLFGHGVDPNYRCGTLHGSDSAK